MIGRDKPEDTGVVMEIGRYKPEDIGVVMERSFNATPRRVLPQVHNSSTPNSYLYHENKI